MKNTDEPTAPILKKPDHMGRRMLRVATVMLVGILLPLAIVVGAFNAAQSISTQHDLHRAELAWMARMERTAPGVLSTFQAQNIVVQNKITNTTESFIQLGNGSFNDVDLWSGGVHTTRVEIDMVGLSNTTLTGIVPGVEGDLLWLWNGGGCSGNPCTITLINGSSSSADDNQIWIANGKQLNIPNNDGVLLIYDHGFGWTVFGGATTMIRAMEFSYDPSVSPTALASGSTTNSYDPWPSAVTSLVFQDVTGSGTATLTGLQAPGAPNSSGRVVVIANTSTAGSLALLCNNGGSTSDDQFNCTATITLLPKETVSLLYNTTVNLWFPLSIGKVPSAGISGLTTNQTVKASSASSVANGWATDDGTTWGSAGKFTINEANGNVNGSGSASFANNLAAGSATITNNISAGSATITGGISAGSATITNNISAGSATITGGISAGSATITNNISAGSASITGGVSAGSATITNNISAGSASITGGISAGSATVTNGVSAGSATITNGISAGSATITNAITAGSIAGVNNTAQWILASSQTVALAATANNVAINKVAIINCTHTGGVDLTGIAMSGGNLAGAMVIVSNASATDIIALENENASSTNLNRIVTPGAIERFIETSGAAILFYVGSGTTGRWHVLAYVSH